MNQLRRETGRITGDEVGIFPGIYGGYIVIGVHPLVEDYGQPSGLAETLHAIQDVIGNAIEELGVVAVSLILPVEVRKLVVAGDQERYPDLPKPMAPLLVVPPLAEIGFRVCCHEGEVIRGIEKKGI